MMQFEPDKKAAALLQKYEPIALNVDLDLCDVSYFGNSPWREFCSEKRRWRINGAEVTETEWQIVYYYWWSQYESGWTDELTKWDFIDLDKEVEKILERIQQNRAP